MMELHPSEMHEAEFDEKFEPLESPGQQQGSHLWERREVLDALDAKTITEEQIWTVTEEDGIWCVSTGWHIVNFIGYYVTQNPWVTGVEVAVLDDMLIIDE